MNAADDNGEWISRRDKWLPLSGLEFRMTVHVPSHTWPPLLFFAVAQASLAAPVGPCGKR
jgi:hypothetical protein